MNVIIIFIKNSKYLVKVKHGNKCGLSHTGKKIDLSFSRWVSHLDGTQILYHIPPLFSDASDAA